MQRNLQKAMLVGMYLSKFDKDGLMRLGFENFSEAFNVIGLAINTKPLSIRNYRDEFDPVFPNKRMGWHKRPMFRTRVEMFEKYKDLNLEDFTVIVKQIIFKNPGIDFIEDKIIEGQDKQNTFAKRLITGQAAEQYFIDNYKKIPFFQGAVLEDTTKYGCGFDFKLNLEGKFFAVEVKGLEKDRGGIGLTNKEYQTAVFLKEDYFIFVVKNFIETPNHKIFKNPIFTDELQFSRQERNIKQINWNATVM